MGVVIYDISDIDDIEEKCIFIFVTICYKTFFQIYFDKYYHVTYDGILFDKKNLHEVKYNNDYTYYINFDAIVDISPHVVHFKHQNITFSDNILSDIKNRWRKYKIDKMMAYI